MRPSPARAALASALAAVAVMALPAPAHAETVTPVPLPFLWKNSAIHGVEAESASNVWVAGVQGSFCLRLPADFACRWSSSGNPVVRQWTGSGFREFPIRDWTGVGPMETVSAHGAETWVMGGGYITHPYLGRFDGTAFQRVPTPGDEVVTFLDTGPAGTWTAHNVHGDTRLFRRTGSSWTRTPVPPALWHVEATGSVVANEAWAVGLRPVPEPRDRPRPPAVARWDGTAWHDVAVPETIRSNRFVAVRPVGPGEFWALGNLELVHHKDGVWTVSPVEAALDRADLDLDPAGNPVATTGMGAFRWVGGVPQRIGTDQHGYVLAVARIPGTDRMWLAGSRDNGATVHSAQP